MSIGFYFSSSGGRLQLPVNPAKVTVKRQGNNKRTEVLLLGEINILRYGKLSGISFEFLLPGDNYYPFLSGPWTAPEKVVEYFDRLVKKGSSTKLTVTGAGISQRVSVEDFSHTRAAGDHDSLQCGISLLEWRSYAASVLVLPTPASTMATASTNWETDKVPNPTYQVQSGDSFWRIAQQQLGSGARYEEVAKLNGLTANSVIHPGDVLKLPER